MGKVMRIFSGNPKDSSAVDNSVQAQLEMWDTNQIIVMVHPSLAGSLKEDDFVLVRYAQPEPIVWRILRQKEGKEVWEELTNFFDRKKTSNQKAAPIIVRHDADIGKMIG
ncbi:MAG: hypothetical protein HYW50_00615 [Candidatus Diapherotrites archaeon]|nr:hypothetical protein [Candidatus Diapherotrites archaeon]